MGSRAAESLETVSSNEPTHILECLLKNLKGIQIKNAVIAVIEEYELLRLEPNLEMCCEPDDVMDITDKALVLWIRAVAMDKGCKSDDVSNEVNLAGGHKCHSCSPLPM